MSLADKLARVVCADADSEETYECKDCGAAFPLDRQTCPDCGGYVIDRIDWDGVVAGDASSP
ncbi:hypothetical protein [Halorussus caseinilyticus]|uniref:Rubrerythrin-like domain-containing protein n=1 Tax=Halorussus caseinilyticus TaxID=3034025 RepID=A0ABD5WN96_9EURY|nr:hypothetical protein [Halorussus sp. DT72]